MFQTGGFNPCPMALAKGGAAAHSRMAADLSALANVAPFAWISVHANCDTVLDYAGMNGIGVGAAPTIADLATGRYTLTWDQSYTDDYGVVLPVNLFMGIGTVNVIQNMNVAVSVLAPNQIEVRVYSSHTAFADDSPSFVVVW